MEEFEAAGDVVTGALVGRAVEPHAGEHGGGGALCLNCGTALIGPHCHRCGQGADVHRSLGAIGHEILHGVVHFEGKLWRTLPMLAWRPGELTRRFVRGERVRFVSPIALFLFSIFTLFAVFSLAGIGPPADLSPTTTQLVSGIATARGELGKSRSAAVEARAKLPSGDARARLDQRIAAIDADLAALGRAAPLVVDPGEDGAVHTGWARLDHGLEKALKNPSLMLYKLQSNSYKFSWLLIPLSLPFVWLMFAWKREYRLYDHMVFVTYSIAAMTLFFIGVTIAAAIGVSSNLLGLLAVTVPVWHLYRQLRGAYALRRSTAILRTIVLSACILVVLILFVAALLALGLLG
jgi:hypothetical protein